MSPDAGSTLLTAEALAHAARVRAAAVKDKSYRVSPIGQDVGRFMRAMKWADRSPNSLDTYEIVLCRLSVDFADRKLEELDVDDVRSFLSHHWGDCSPATRRNRLAIVKSFLSWCVDEGKLASSPAQSIKAPKRTQTERQAYAPDVIDSLRDAQPSLRDQICVQLVGRLALRKDELRRLQVGDFDLARGTVRVHGKGNKIVVLPIGFKLLKRDLEVHLVGLAADEYLLYPRGHKTRPMNPASIHRWFKKCLERAGLPTTMKLHEMRHSAGDNLWRDSGNMILAQQLLRHESPATTAAYLHPTRADLEVALEALDK